MVPFMYMKIDFCYFFSVYFKVCGILCKFLSELIWDWQRLRDTWWYCCVKLKILISMIHIFYWECTIQLSWSFYKFCIVEHQNPDPEEWLVNGRKWRLIHFSNHLSSTCLHRQSSLVENEQGSPHFWCFSWQASNTWKYLCYSFYQSRPSFDKMVHRVYHLHFWIFLLVWKSLEWPKK